MGNSKNEIEFLKSIIHYHLATIIFDVMKSKVRTKRMKAIIYPVVTYPVFVLLPPPVFYNGILIEFPISICY